MLAMTPERARWLVEAIRGGVITEAETAEVYACLLSAWADEYEAKAGAPHCDGESCGTCRFGFIGASAAGLCRKRAPVVVQKQTHVAGKARGRAQTRYPETAAHLWCGEWKPRGRDMRTAAE